MSLDLASLAERLAGAASGDLALQDWSLHGSERRRLSFGVKDRETANAHAPLTIAESLTVHYKLVWQDGRLSRGTIERDRVGTDARELLADARESAYDDPDAAWVHGPTTYPDVELFDPRSAAIADGDVEELAWRLDAIRRRLAGMDATWSGSFSGGDGTARVMTSRGVDVDGRGSSTGWYVMLDGRIGDGDSGRGPDPRGSFENKLDALVEHVAQLSGEPAAIEAGRHRVVLHPDVATRYAMLTLLHHFYGSTIAHDEGRFSREDFVEGRRVFPERLTVFHDPLQPLAPGSYRFTGEGVPAAAGYLIKQGCLGTPLLDLKSARRLELEPTPAIVDVEALRWELGTSATISELLADDEVTIVVLSVLGIHTQDPASGDFSLSAPHALAFRGGKCLGPLPGTLSGNLFDCLDDPETTLVEFPTERTPGMLWRATYAPR